MDPWTLGHLDRPFLLDLIFYIDCNKMLHTLFFYNLSKIRCPGVQGVQSIFTPFITLLLLSLLLSFITLLHYIKKRKEEEEEEG